LIRTGWSRSKRTLWCKSEPKHARMTPQELERAVQAKTNNPDLVSPLLADKFVNTARDGKVTGKAESLAGGESDQIRSCRLRRCESSNIGYTH